MRISEFIERLDNDPELINQEIDSLLIWPVIRYAVLQRLIDQENDLNDPYVAPILPRFVSILGAILSSIRWSPFFGPVKPILIFHTAASNILMQDGKHFNRVVDYFVEENPEQVWKIEEPLGFVLQTPKTYASHSKLSFILLAEIVSRSTATFKKQKYDLVESKIESIIWMINRNLFDLKIQIIDDSFISRLVKIVLKMGVNYYLYKKLFRMKKTKILLVEDGHYGLDKAIIIKAAKDAKINVIEPQHGFLNANHPAYNYGELVLSDIRYRSYFPDTLLCYGDFWARDIKIPNKKVVIGNPHLEKSLKTVTNISECKRILVLGSGVTVNETNELLNELYRIKPQDYDLFYRPHPMERSEVVNRYGVQLKKGIWIDTDELYCSLASAEIIIGELTTTIFEATALKKKIYLFNSSYTKTYFDNSLSVFRLISISNLNEIFEEDLNANTFRNYFWHIGWQKAYKELLQKENQR